MHYHVHKLVLAILLLVVPISARADFIFFPPLAGGAITNINGARWAESFPGADIGAKVNEAIKDLGTQGGVVMIGPGLHTFATTIQCPISGDIPIIITGAVHSGDYSFTGTTLHYIGSADAVNQMTNVQNSRGCELRDLTLDGGSAGPNAVGFHFGGTIYSKTQDVMIRNFVGSCIELDNQADPGEPAVGNHWTERYDFHQTAFSECGTEIYFHSGVGPTSFMHGRMDIHAGLFGAQNGLVIDGVAEPLSVDFTINGNMAPDSTGALIKLTGGSYLDGRLQISPECMNTTPCTRFDIDSASHIWGQVVGKFSGAWTDKLPKGADLRVAYSDTRFIAPAHSTCLGDYTLNPGQTAEMFTVQNWGGFAVGPLAIATRAPGAETVRYYNLAASSCSSVASFSLAKETVYAGGAPFTVNENCYTSTVVGNGTAANPEFPTGSTQYTVTNNAPVAVSLWFSFQNLVIDPIDRVLGPLASPEICSGGPESYLY